MDTPAPLPPGPPQPTGTVPPDGSVPPDGPPPSHGPMPPSDASVPRRSPWRNLLVVAAVTVGVLLSLWAFVIVMMRDDDGVSACRQIAELAEEGEYASASRGELDDITVDMSGAYDDELAALGRAYQRQLWLPGAGGDGYPLDGTPAADALIDITRAPCQRISANDKPWPF